MMMSGSASAVTSRYSTRARNSTSPRSMVQAEEFNNRLSSVGSASALTQAASCESNSSNVIGRSWGSMAPSAPQIKAGKVGTAVAVAVAVGVAEAAGEGVSAELVASVGEGDGRL